SYAASTPALSTLSLHDALPISGYAAGFNTAQLNRDFNYDGIVDNQIRALNHVNYFSNNVTGLNTLRTLGPLADNSISLEYRVRSDRKSTRLNSSHQINSYAAFC